VNYNSISGFYRYVSFPVFATRVGIVIKNYFAVGAKDGDPALVGPFRASARAVDGFKYSQTCHYVIFSWPVPPALDHESLTVVAFLRRAQRRNAKREE
jgi:hypothetical protein